MKKVLVATDGEASCAHSTRPAASAFIVLKR
jgi:hypothetical protein